MLNPLGTGKFINLRFYEALKLGCIPIQQVTSDMINWYGELTKCVYFTDTDNLSPDYINQFECIEMDYYLEDHFESINLKSFIG